MENADLPASPTPYMDLSSSSGELHCDNGGLTKREMFAMEAMKAMISNAEVFGVGDMENSKFHKAIKSSCYSIADIMLGEK